MGGWNWSHFLVTQVGFADAFINNDVISGVFCDVFFTTKLLIFLQLSASSPPHVSYWDFVNYQKKQ